MARWASVQCVCVRVALGSRVAARLRVMWRRCFAPCVLLRGEELATARLPYRPLSMLPSTSESTFDKQQAKQRQQRTVSPIVHAATAVLAFFAGFINAVGVGCLAKTIGNVTGLVTNLAVGAVDRANRTILALQFFSFGLGSVLSGVLISSRKVGIGTELYGIVLLLVSALIFAGWANALSPDVLPSLLAIAMGLQNGMLTKHA